jgi:hypothetical protein
MPVRDRMYDRQPQLVATPEDEEDDEMDYHDEEFVLFLSSPPSLPPSLLPSLFDLFYFLFVSIRSAFLLLNVTVLVLIPSIFAFFHTV